MGGTTAFPAGGGTACTSQPRTRARIVSNTVFNRRQRVPARQQAARPRGGVVPAATGSEPSAQQAPGPASAAAPPAAVPSSLAGGVLPAAPSRLQQEVELLVALDVEYTHLKLVPGGRHVTLPAEVCAVDAGGRVLLYEHCNPSSEGPLASQQQQWRHVGGLPPALWRVASPLGEVRQRLAALLQGRILVGHHLSKDLGALQLHHPWADQRDTLRYRQLQGRRGAGRKLRQLSAEKLGREIQRTKRHSPREDAQAAMDLYLQHVHFEKQYMRYEDLVELHLAQLGSGGRGSSDSAEASNV
ncbi:hypothetical protein D9Q98_001255 [Chlorella vulgaris]|uniref:Exonuclease domain-containing protein n=1 Tax=Chlorella vulgaris TaxID=3077 RepID=A0A9D4TZS7_CHLVU|nr:hypothetical protein D9Q98_001255 [Chlorella vulgaris]